MTKESSKITKNKIVYKKYDVIGISSILIGLIVVAFIVYFNLRFIEIQSQNELISYFIYGPTNRKILYSISLIGIVVAVIARKKSKSLYGTIGQVICIADLIWLLLWPF